MREPHRQFFKEWRKYRDLTQEQLADRIGIARSYLTKIENGSRRYDQPFLEAAAYALRCEPCDLIMRDPSNTQALWSIVEQLNNQERIQAYAMLSAMRAARIESDTGTER